MKICLPIQPRPEGGAYTFIRNFRNYVKRHAIPFTDRLDEDYDTLFTNSWLMDYEVLRQEKKRKPGIRIVHRVDGSARDYGRLDDADTRQARVNLLADLTIFQSRHSRYSSMEKFRVIALDGPVIYNPVDTEVFTPHGELHPLPKTGHPRVVNVCWSTNRMKGTWQMAELAKAFPSVDFILCGRYEFTGTSENVVYLDPLPPDDLARVLRSCDVFLNLSENDPSPNVVLEALSSGLPVLYKDSGGVPELVGDAGRPTTFDNFYENLTWVLSHRQTLSSVARQRAEMLYSPDVIFPKYLAAMRPARSRPLPSPLVFVRMHAAGYPVLHIRLLPRLKSVVLGALRRVGSSALATRDALESRRGAIHPCEGGLRPTFFGTKPYRIGWICPDFFQIPRRHFGVLQGFERMRVENVARWINRSSGLFHNEFYRPQHRYQVVVFQKMMDYRSQEEARRIQGYGGKVIFDANVNYYEMWGDYDIPGTRPTRRQQEDAEEMTRNADWVVADSEYLATTIKKRTPKVTFIPDNVDLSVFMGVRTHAAGKVCVMIWSGIGKKALHLTLIQDTLARLKGVELWLVSNDIPERVSRTLRDALPCRVYPYSDQRYAKLLMQADIVISPKRLQNGYEMGHTEYKITLGMAVGLPAVASPQPSYVEAISHQGAGFIAEKEEDWFECLNQLVADPGLRADMGSKGIRTVAERYSTPVVAKQYLELFQSLA